MKANELMVGDWVYYNPNVFIDDEYEQAKPIETLRIERGEDLDWADEGCYAPIPLTEEILKANGIPETELKGFFQARNSRCTITIDFADVNIRGEVHSDTASFMMRFRYVHELQHALRLCGLTELADNFRIEQKEKN